MNSTFFAARNGYNGFTSYFNCVFTPEHFQKIFILKGGPGTGKSTLMKRVRDALSSYGLTCQSILCSSDTNSLDGVIVENRQRRVAILDGTAPHITDPTLPVACEEIINLAQAIKEDIVAPKRASLASLSKAKGEEYKLAYHFLCVCGEIRKYYTAVSEEGENSNEEKLLREIISKLTYAKRSFSEIRLYSAFGREGEVRLDYDLPSHTRQYSVSNNPKLVEYILDYIRSGGIESVTVVDHLDGTTRMIYVPSVDLALHINDELRFIESTAESIYKDAMAYAQDHFKKASEHHFAMEAIYKEALDFTLLDNLTLGLTEKIKVIFSIS